MADTTGAGTFQFYSKSNEPSLTSPPPPQLPLPPIPSGGGDIFVNSSKQALRSPRSKKSTHFSKPLPAPPPPLPSKQQTPSEPLPSPPKRTYEEHEREQPHMLSTPLPDYKHSANQSTKTRAAALEAAKAAAREKARKSSHSGGSAERKNAALARSGSVSSTTNSSGLTTVTTRRSTADDYAVRPFTRRNGRRYLRDPTNTYPLPVDLGEIHRQTLRTMLLCQVFGGPTCSYAAPSSKPPKRVLEVGCGTGFWSVRCHRYFSQRGFSNTHFTGLDIAPLAQRIEDGDMNWRFVCHDLRTLPLPFRDEEFGLVMVKDLSLVTMGTAGMKQELMDEYLRILKPGGTLEIWDGDHSLRMLVPQPKADEETDIHAPGTYTITPQTRFAAPQNQYLVEYNTWITKALEKRQLMPMPCTALSPMLLQESELVDLTSKRLAIPLSEVRWEREGVGGVTKGKAAAQQERKTPLTAAQAALRRTALMTVVQMVESLEPVLREVSGKGQDEWDRWQGGMMSDLLKTGTGWGECLEVGAWWARKKGK